MIQGFRCAETRAIFERTGSRKFRNIERTALRKLLQLDAATSLNDLGGIPGNRLEALKGEREGQHSIRVNDQWRLCFRWTASGPADVEIVDYH